MNIGSVIRKYRKEAGLTQEEMANRLGVTTPAVNKWENGYSYPDIELLAPIARLLGISLDTLMSFHEELTSTEIGDIIRHMERMFEKEGYEKTYEWALEKIKEYPNCNMLIWQIAVMLDARRLKGACAEPEKYDRQINAWYEIALGDENESIKLHAADSLFGFYLRKKEYTKAEEYLKYFSDYDPLKIIFQAKLYQEQGKKQEACEVLEGLLFSEYQTLISVFSFMLDFAVNEEDIERACFLAEKMAAVAGTFEIGKYSECRSMLDAVCAEKNLEGIYQATGLLLQKADRPYDLRKSRLFRHMKFSCPNASYADDPESAVLYQAAIVSARSVWRGEDSHER